MTLKTATTRKHVQWMDFFLTRRALHHPRIFVFSVEVITFRLAAFSELTTDWCALGLAVGHDDISPKRSFMAPTVPAIAASRPRSAAISIPSM